MFKLTFLTPERKLVVDQELEMVIVPGELGEIQILKGHAPLITTLSTGILKWKLKSEDQVKSAVISWGYCEVFPAGVRLLVNLADFANEINVEENEKIIKESEARLATEFMDDLNWESVQRELARARAGLQLLQHPGT